MLKGVAVTIILRTFVASINHSTQSTVIINIKTLKIMKNLNRNEMNAVLGGIGPKSSVAGALGGVKVQKYSCWPKSWKISACAGGPADTVDIDNGCTPT